MKFALATSPQMPDLYEDDQLLQQALIAKGHIADAVCWDDMGADWRDYDAVVVRSTWDYHGRISEFLNWLDYLENEKINVWNRADLMRWNTDKRYLRELEARGVPIVPTFWIHPQEQPPYLEEIMNSYHWLEAVIKPAVSAGSFLTHRFHVTEANEQQNTLEHILKSGTAMVQPFVQEIETVGEYSFIFFGGEYQFAIIKKPKSGDFRVQLEFGGSLEVIDPSEDLIKQAEKVMRLLEQPTLYARVDGVVIDGEFRLMELELIEPYLSLGHHPGAADRLADVLVAYME